MSRQIKGFADYFMQGMALGGQWAEKWEASQIAKARNEIMSKRDANVDRRENAKLGLYGQKIAADAELAKARAFRAMNPVAKGGGKGAGGPDAGAEQFVKDAAKRGIIAAPGQEPPIINVTGGGNGGSGGDDGGGGSSDAGTPPAEGGYASFAEGGIVEGMSLNEARSYDTAASGTGAAKKSKPAAANPFGSAMSAAGSKYKEPEKEKVRDEAGAVRPTGPQGSGVGGSYTTADTGPGGVIDTQYRAGGVVRNFAEGGAVGKDLTDDYDADGIAQEMRRYMAQTNWQPNPPEQRGGIQDMGGSANAATGNTSGTVGGSTAAGGGGSEAAVGGTGGVGGSASSDAGAGGSAAAGTGGADGGTYRRGGGVRRFQSGGRVMREPTAIDTGTSGPTSGYGYRAPPPGNAQRRY